MMTEIGPPPPPPSDDPLIVQVNALTGRMMALQIENAHMQQQIARLQGDAERLDSERQWWQRWHLKWGPLFHRWRDGNDQGSGDE